MSKRVVRIVAQRGSRKVEAVFTVTVERFTAEEINDVIRSLQREFIVSLHRVAYVNLDVPDVWLPRSKSRKAPRRGK